LSKKRRAPKKALPASGRTSYVVGLDGHATKADGQSPLFNAFMGIHSGTNRDFTNSPEGLKDAYLKSVLVMRCIRIRAHTLASIPRRIVRSDGQSVIENHPLELLFGQRHNRLFRTTETDLCIFGNAYWLPVEAAPRRWEIHRLNPMTMEILRDRHGIHGYRQRIDGMVTGEWYPDEIIQFSDYDPEDDLAGLSLTQWVLKTVSVDLSLEQFAKTYFENDATPAGILTTDQIMLPPDRESYKQQWKKEFRGVEKMFKVALLDKGTSYQSITPALKDLAMKDLDEKSMRRIALAFGVPMTIVGMNDAANFATINSQHKILYTEAVIPEMEMILDTLNEHPFAKSLDAIIEPNVNEIEVLQEDRTEITQRSTQAFTGGIRSLNEARDLEDLQALPVDVFMIPGVGLISRADLESGKLPPLQTNNAAPALPFGSFFPPAPAALPAEAAATPGESRRDESVGRHAAGGGIHGEVSQSPQVIEGKLLAPVLNSKNITKAFEIDLRAWKRKVGNRGLPGGLDFSPDFLTSAYADFVRIDLQAGKEPDALFDEIIEAFKAADENLPTPEEFEAYWQGIGSLHEQLGAGVEGAWAGMMNALAALIRENGQSANIEPVLKEFDDKLQSALEVELAEIYLAGAARGNDLLNNARLSANPAKAILNTNIAWDILNTDASVWARQFAGQQVALMGDTTRRVLANKIGDWIDQGGSLEDLANLMEGQAVEFPLEWKPGQLEWITSQERAQMVAQTITTNAYHEGVSARWQQAGIQEFKWRTQNDRLVCVLCKRLNNETGTLAKGVYDSETGKYYKPAAHGGCRCFSAPELP
jgi:HK97 family phage portal protein